jgi:hypothetical protein
VSLPGRLFREKGWRLKGRPPSNALRGGTEMTLFVLILDFIAGKIAINHNQTRLD